MGSREQVVISLFLMEKRPDGTLNRGARLWAVVEYELRHARDMALHGAVEAAYAHAKPVGLYLKDRRLMVVNVEVAPEVSSG